MSPRNSSATKAQGSDAKSTQASMGSHRPTTPSHVSRPSTDTSEARHGNIQPGKGTSFTMQRWLEETPKEEAWSGLSRLGGGAAGTKEETKKADGGSERK